MDEEFNVQTLKQKAVQSVFWVYLSNVTLKGLGIVVTLILAKLLFPEDFGVIAIATVIIGFLQATAMLGLNSAIIQKYKIDKEAVSTCFFYICSMGIFITILTMCIAPYIAAFYKMSLLTKVLQGLSLTILFSTIGIVPATLLEKKLSFKKRCFSEIIPQFLYAGVSIVLAFLGFGVMSIVYGQIIARGFETFFVFFFNPIEIVWKVNFQIFKEMFSYGKELLFLSYLTYFVLNFDNLFVGKLLGAAQLGFYAVAYTIGNSPTTHITNVIQRVSFPFLAQVQNNKSFLQQGVLKLLTFTLFFSIPLTVGIIFFGKYILCGFYGDKWLPIILPLHILVVMGFLRGVGANFSSFFCAIGKPKLVRNVTLLMVCMMIVLIYPLTKWEGIIGTAVCILLLAITSCSILMYAAITELEIKAGQIWDITKPFIKSTALTMIILFISRILIFKTPSFIQVIEFMSFAIVIYAGCIYYFNKSIIQEIKMIKTYFQVNKKQEVLN